MSDERKVEQVTHEEQLTRQIVSRAQDHVKLRDLLAFAFARIWAVVLVLGAVLFALSSRPQQG